MPRLIITKPERPPEFVYFDKAAEIVVGRSSRCGIALDFDPMVSRMHAVFMIEPGKVSIKDLNSTNGFRINGEQYGGGSLLEALTPLELRDGDEVIVGATRFRVELAPERESLPDALSPVRGDQHPRLLRSPMQTRRLMESDPQSTVDETVSGLGQMLPHIPGYRLMRFLAEGRVGKIYLGVPNGEERSVAVRVMYPPTGITPELLKFFFSEFDAARNVAHPNLARLFGGGELSKGGGVFIAAEYVGGENLAEYIRRRPDGRVLSGEAVGIMVQVAGAVCRLHRQNITHLDMTPASVIIRDDNGRVVAKVTGVGFSDFTEMAGLLPPVYTGNEIKRLAFLAPEQMSTDVKAGVKTDVFALAAMLFYLIAGVSPYKFVEGGNNREVVERGAMWDLNDLVKGVPEALLEIVRTGLSRDPEGRYADACQFLAALDNMLV